jgi:hypothetical protein
VQPDLGDPLIVKKDATIEQVVRTSSRPLSLVLTLELLMCSVQLNSSFSLRPIQVRSRLGEIVQVRTAAAEGRVGSRLCWLVPLIHMVETRTDAA